MAKETVKKSEEKRHKRGRDLEAVYQAFIFWFSMLQKPDDLATQVMFAERYDVSEKTLSAWKSRDGFDAATKAQIMRNLKGHTAAMVDAGIKTATIPNKDGDAARRQFLPLVGFGHDDNSGGDEEGYQRQIAVIKLILERPE